MFEHGERLERRLEVRAGDVLYEAPAEWHQARNEGPADALALLAAVDPDPRRVGAMLRRWTHDGEPVRRSGQARVTEEAGVRRRFLVEPGDFGSVTFTVTEVAMEPGAASEWHAHPGAEHALVVLEGRGMIEVGDIAETLEPLKGIRVLPGRPHRVVNDSRLLLRYWVCASPGLDPTVDREPAEPPRRHLGR